MLQTELITRNRTLYGGTASSWDLVWRCDSVQKRYTMTINFLGVSDQATLPLQLLLIGLSANDNLMTGDRTPSSWLAAGPSECYNI